MNITQQQKDIISNYSDEEKVFVANEFRFGNTDIQDIINKTQDNFQKAYNSDGISMRLCGCRW